MPSAAAFRRLLERNPERDSLQKQQRKLRRRESVPSKADYDPDAEDYSVEGRHTLSIKELLDIGQKQIYANLQALLKGDTQDQSLLRVDYYFLKTEKQWYPADTATIEGRLIVNFLRRSKGCPKPFIDGQLVLSHFWLQYGKDYDASTYNSGMMGIGLFDDEYNLGDFPDHEEKPEVNTETDENRYCSDYETGLDKFIDSLRTFRDEGIKCPRDTEFDEALRTLQGIPVLSDTEVAFRLRLANAQASRGNPGWHLDEGQVWSHFREWIRQRHAEAEYSTVDGLDSAVLYP